MDTHLNGAASKPELPSVVVRMMTDPVGITEYPGSPRVAVAIHVGPAVYMDCKRGGLKHSGLGVHADMEVIPAHTPSVWEPKDEDTALVLALDPRVLSRAAEDSGEDPARLEIRNRFQIRDVRMEHIGWALKAEMEMGYPNGRVFSDSLATAMAAHLLSRHSNLNGPSEIRSGGVSGHVLKRVLAFIEDGLARDLSLNEIAAVAGVSASHFKVMFRQSMGMPVHQYIVGRRVDTAALLLRKSSLPISQVAQETGFAHQSHLSHHMRRVLGYPPAAIRKLAR